jgi:thiol-disulfide isomerase/thioredoxin
MRTRRPLEILLAVSVVLALATAACGGQKPDTPASSKGQLLPSRPDQLPTFDPATFRRLIAQLHGKPVVVNVWASWCGPCTAEAPELAAVARATRGRVQFLGVDILDQVTPARAFIHKYGWIYPSVFDPTAAIRDGLGFLGQPFTLVFDRQGEQVWAWYGPVTKDLLTAELKTLHAV